MPTAMFFLFMCYQDSWNKFTKCGSRVTRIWNAVSIVARKVWQIAWGITIALLGSKLLESRYGNIGIHLYFIFFFTYAFLWVAFSSIVSQLSAIRKDPATSLLLAFPLPPIFTSLVRSFTPTVIGTLADSIIRARLMYFIVLATVFHMNWFSVLRGIIALIVLSIIAIIVRVRILYLCMKHPTIIRLGAPAIEQIPYILMMVLQMSFYMSTVLRVAAPLRPTVFAVVSKHVITWWNPFALPVIFVWPKIAFFPLIAWFVWGGIMLVVLLWSWRFLLKLKSDPNLHPDAWFQFESRRRVPTAVQSVPLPWVDRPLTRFLLRLPRVLSIGLIWAYFTLQEIPVRISLYVLYPGLIILMWFGWWLFHETWWSFPLHLHITHSSMQAVIALTNIGSIAWLIFGQRVVRNYVIVEALGPTFFYFRSIAWRMQSLIMARAICMFAILWPLQILYSLIVAGARPGTWSTFAIWEINNTLLVLMYVIWYIAGTSIMPDFTWRTNVPSGLAQSLLSPGAALITWLSTVFMGICVVVGVYFHLPLTLVLVVVTVLGIIYFYEAGDRLDHLSFS